MASNVNLEPGLGSARGSGPGSEFGTVVPLAVNGISIGMYPDEGDAGGRKTYLSELNLSLQHSFDIGSHSHLEDDHRAVQVAIATVGWYAQTYPGEVFRGSQLLPLVSDLKKEFIRLDGKVRFVYEASVMPFQSWSGYTHRDSRKASEIARVMQTILDHSRISSHDHNLHQSDAEDADANANADGADFCISEIRLRFGHEVNYYIKSGLYPPPTRHDDAGYDFRTAFEVVAASIRGLPSTYSSKIKMVYCPNIASSNDPGLALREYELFLPPLEIVDLIGIDYYCPALGCLSPKDLVSKLKPFHDKYTEPSQGRYFILGETGLHFHHTLQTKLEWLHTITSSTVTAALPHLISVSWFNYQKDRDYRILHVDKHESHLNHPLVSLIRHAQTRTRPGHKHNAQHATSETPAQKVKGFLHTLLNKRGS
ncbi:hypothetical protein BCV70DRAFT_203388 [Testicularia cyperi]|uniref:Uncharacterized protein n=1 Tax=Testicularia cyperi TaxID=1882483 RepID=A0A317XE09_9BASI|nr:hypothetical protein BCV70DRAFT_203388 [Testicularia cyperi]